MAKNLRISGLDAGHAFASFLELVPTVKNARTHSDGQVEKLVRSIREFEAAPAARARHA